MTDSPLERTAEEFRTLVRQAAEQGRLAPAPTPAVDAAELAATLRAAVADAVAESVAANASGPVSLDPTLIARLEAAADTLSDRSDDDVLLHLRNVLPGQIRQEFQQQAQGLQQRMGGLEQQVAALQADTGWGREIARALLTGAVVAIVLLFAVVFQKQIQDWGRDAIYPLLGITIKEASTSMPRLASPSSPPERR